MQVFRIHVQKVGLPCSFLRFVRSLWKPSTWWILSINAHYNYRLLEDKFINICSITPKPLFILLLMLDTPLNCPSFHLFISSENSLSNSQQLYQNLLTPELPLFWYLWKIRCSMVIYCFIIANNYSKISFHILINMLDAPLNCLSLFKKLEIQWYFNAS